MPWKRVNTLAILLAILAIAPARAEEGPVSVKFTSRPDGATVVVDGKDRCVAPCKMTMHAGTHVVGMSRDGYLAREEMVEVSARTRTVTWELEEHLGQLTVLSDPGGVTVQIRPKKGKTRTVKTPVEGLALPGGTYLVVLTDERFASQERTATVTPGEGAQIFLEPVPTMGSLSVTVVDEGGDRDKANITLNGKRYRGIGPWTLKPGIYQVKVTYRGKVILEQPVQVEAGSDVSLDVESEPQP